MQLLRQRGLFRYDRTPKPAYAAFRGFTAETTPPQASITGGAGPGKLHQGLDPDASPSPRTRPARPSSAGSTQGPSSACSSPLHDSAALGRRPHLLRQGDRRPREREPDRLAVLHRRHPRPAGAPDHRHRPRLAGQQQRPRGAGAPPAAGTTVRLYKTAGCTGHRRGPGHGRQVRLARASPPLVARQHDDRLPRQGDGRRRQHLGVLGRRSPTSRTRRP